MTSNVDNPRETNGLRRPITEAEVLAVVEQIADPSETIGASRDRHLARRLDDMRLDREALVSLGEVAAPGDLVSDAIAEAADDGLDRRALLGLARSEQSQTGIAISKVTITRDRLVEHMLDRPVRWSVSAAAGVLLMLGVGAFLLAKQLDSRVQSDPPSAVVALGDEEPPEPQASAEKPKAQASSPEHAEPPPVEASPSVPERPQWTAVESIQQAGEALASGRLALRVIAADAESARAAMASLAIAARDGPSTWAFETTGQTMSGPVAEMVPLSSAAAGDLRASRAPDRLGVWSATLERRGAALAAFRAALEDAGFEVEMIRATERLPLEPPLGPALDADAVSWWNDPPSAWPDRARVPVIVETRPE